MDIKTDVEFTRSTRATDIYAESSCEYVLPDYNGDVRKILFTRAEVRPSGKFANGDEVELSGVVVYDIIYLDAENALSSTSFTSEYDFLMKCSGDRYKDAIADTRIANFAIRLNGPRKIAAKSSVVSTVRISESASVNVSGDAFDEKYEPEADLRDLGIRETVSSSVTEREYAESLAKLDGAIADEVEIIYSGAEAFAESAEYDDGLVEIEGKLRMMAVVKVGDMPAYLVEKTVELDEKVPIEGGYEDMKLIPEVKVSSVKASVNPEETGSEIVMSVIVEFSAVGEGNTRVSLMVDSFLKACPCENTYEELSYSEFVDALAVKLSHSAEVSRAEIDSDGLREVVFLDAVPKLESLEKYEDSCKLRGEVRYSGVASEMDGEGQVSYVMLKFSSPFECVINHGYPEGEELRFETKLSAHGTSASIDSGKIYASCTLDVGCVVYRDKSERILASSFADSGHSFDRAGSKITVYYPSGDETLFDVAKKFHTSTVKVAADNSLDASVMSADVGGGGLAGVKKLLIYG